MRKIYKNDIYRIIKEDMKFDPNNFILTDSLEDGFETSKLTLLGSNMNFIFRNRSRSWEEFEVRFNNFKPGYPLTTWQPNTRGLYLSYEEAANVFENWLKSDVKLCIEEKESIDIWKNFQFESGIFELTQIRFANNSNFDINESKKIINSIDNLKKLIIENLNPTHDQVIFINQRLDYLANSVNRLGKFDWSNAFLSIMISIAINMTVDTQTANRLFHLIKDAFSSIKSLFEN